MDQFNPKDDVTDFNTLSDSPNTQSPAPTPTNFYKEFVQFAIFLGVVLVPVYASFDYIVEGLQAFIADYTVQYSDQNTTGAVRYTLNKNVARTVIAACLLAAFTIIFLLRHSLRVRASRHHPRNSIAIVDNSAVTGEDRKIKELSRQLDQQRYQLRKIQSQIFSDNARVRHDFVSFRAKYYVHENGDIEVTKEVILRAPELEVPFWMFFVNGEAHALPLRDDSEMNLEVSALGNNKTDVVALLIDNEPTKKVFSANFIPIIAGGETRSFMIRYRWPGFFRELVLENNTHYFWETSSFTDGSRSDFTAEWHFSEILGNVYCTIPPKYFFEGMHLRSEQNPRGPVWIYEGRNVPIGNERLGISITRISN